MVEKGAIAPSTLLGQNIPYIVALQQSDDMLVLAKQTSVKYEPHLQNHKNKQPTFCPLQRKGRLFRV